MTFLDWELIWRLRISVIAGVTKELFSFLKIVFHAFRRNSFDRVPMNQLISWTAYIVMRFFNNCYTRCVPQYVILVPGYFRLFPSVMVCQHALQRNRWISACHSIEDPANIGISLIFVHYLEYLCTFPTQRGQETDSDLRILRKFRTTGAVVTESIMPTH